MIRFALNLKYVSSSAYRAMHQSGVISLPSERTLADYTHWATPHSGVQLEFVEKLLSMLTKEVICGQHHCSLSMDEMKLKSGLVFNKHTGILCGFVNLGNVKRYVDMAVSGENEESPANELAEQAFVFLARAVFKSSPSVPVAHYFSAKLTGIIRVNVSLYVYVTFFLFSFSTHTAQERRYFLWCGKLLKHWRCTKFRSYR